MGASEGGGVGAVGEWRGFFGAGFLGGRSGGGGVGFGGSEEEFVELVF